MDAKEFNMMKEQEILIAAKAVIDYCHEINYCSDCLFYRNAQCLWGKTPDNMNVVERKTYVLGG